MKDSDKIDFLRDNKQILLKVINKEISESQFNAMRYNTEEIYQQVLDLKTIKYILEEL